ncbi:hypothetical protein KIS4809_5736 [Bacillus sp. ZZV12-4809]|nr:hypothetical protein KIS4809_5736 [Bacillus sp. ZZV12-4809]
MPYFKIQLPNQAAFSYLTKPANSLSIFFIKISKFIVIY